MLNLNPQSPYLRDIAEAFRRRHRAISSKSIELLGERLFENHQGTQLEKIEFTFRRRRMGKAPVVRLFIWSDRWVWIDAREASKLGWRWQWTDEGRTLTATVGQTMVQAFEESLAAIWGEPRDIEQRLHAIWKPLLATGPQV
jgi:hypothetical protein